MYSYIQFAKKNIEHVIYIALEVTIMLNMWICCSLLFLTVIFQVLEFMVYIFVVATAFQTQLIS